ncbi:MAG: GTPase ObgE [Eubacteriales bacterium]|nr:GTPase ObgE [Eubacteriales bacterium]
MFIDRVDIYIKAGRGGNGAVSFLREKYISHGGPDGGDGGKGGNIIFSVDEGSNTLLDYKNRRKFVAGNGENGTGKKFHGKSAGDMILKVPRGTVIRHKETGKVIHDMSDGQDYIAAHGGKGGWGNARFATSTRQAPRFAKAGHEGDEFNLTLELKMLADVGLIGYPNVGKSTILSMVTSACPKIANYHFTTITPNLGVISAYDKSFVMADIPGLVEGASEGKGLGHEFLRHIDRCRLLVHVFDISAAERPDPLEDIKTINRELKKYSPELAKRPQILAANKIDIDCDKEKLKKIKAYAARKKQPVFLVSAALGEGLDELLERIVKDIALLPSAAVYEREYFEDRSEREEIAVENKNGIFYVVGNRLKHLCENINFDDRESLAFFQRTLKNAGVIDILEQKGIQEGDTVDIYGIQFDFVF